MSAMVNPLRSDPTLMVAHARVAAGDLGQRLAVYATARLAENTDDPLTVLGLPLIDELIATIGENPSSVAAVSSGSAWRREQWNLVLGFSSELRATVDLAAGLLHAQVGELDLRFDWSGASQAILAEPTAVAVTVTRYLSGHRRSAEVEPLFIKLLAFAESARSIAANPPPEWAVAARVIAAAREAATSGERVMIG
jgi:hypothetical protein